MPGEKNGNGKSLIWRSAVGILIAVLSFLSTFMFNRVVALPETYVKINVNKEMHQSQDKRQERLENKIDRGFEKIQQQYIEINQYLRDKAGDRRPGDVRDGG